MGQMVISVIISKSTLGDSFDNEISCYLSLVQALIEREYPETSVSVCLSSNDQSNIVSIRRCPVYMERDEVYNFVTDIIDYLWKKPCLWHPSMK